VRDFFGKLGLKDPRPEGVEAMAKRCEVSVADRREAVLSLLRREEAAAVIARRVGVSEPTLYRWRDEFLAAGEAALAGGGGQKNADPLRRRIAELEHQIEKRDQVIGEYTIANRILKKLSGQSP
jgi:transposase-like protein